MSGVALSRAKARAGLVDLALAGLIAIALVSGDALADAGGAPEAPPAPSGEAGQEADQETEPAEPADPPLVRRGNELMDKLDALIARADELQSQIGKAEVAEVAVLEHQLAETKLQYLDLVDDLVANLSARQLADLDVTDVEEWLLRDFADLAEAIVQHIEIANRDFSALLAKRADTDRAELLALEQEISKQRDWLEKLYQGYDRHVEHLAIVGMDDQPARADLAERAAKRADRLAGRIELTAEEMAQLAQRIQNDPSDLTLEAQYRGLEERKRSLVKAMSALVKILDDVGVSSDDYRKLLITSTGQVTVDVFKAKVALGLLEGWLSTGRKALDTYGPAVVFKALLFLLVIAAFWLTARLMRRGIQRGFTGDTVHTSQLLQNMVLSMFTRVVMIIGLLLALSVLGIELGPLLAGLGIAGFIVGFALQDSLSNFAAGVMILAYRPFDVDDMIEAGGVYGRVSHMSLVSTTILTIDNQTLIVPNAKIWGDVIKNVTQQLVRRVDMTFTVAYSEDLEHVEEVLAGVLRADPRVLPDPEPMIKLHKMVESGLEFVVRPWVNTDDYWDVYWDTTREVKKRFDAEGISIPLPQRHVHLSTLPEGLAPGHRAD